MVAAVLDGVSLDQLKAFIAAVEEGSFSAAGRRLNRAQSAISELVGKLEAQIGVQLFDRSERYPRLTSAGTLLLTDARSVVSGVDQLKARANGIAGGLEPELAAVIDVLFPIEVIAEASLEFRTRFPNTPLRLYVDALGGAVQPVLDGRCGFGVVSFPDLPDSMRREQVQRVPTIMVAAHNHPLASHRGLIPRAELSKHVQLVLTDRSNITSEREFGVMSPLTWRLSDLFAKHSFLLKGLGWGGMPLYAVMQDLLDGRLVRLLIEDLPENECILSMFAVYPASRPPGPAGRWLIDRLKQCPPAELPQAILGTKTSDVQAATARTR